MSEELSEHVRFIGGPNNNTFVWVVPNQLGDSYEVVDVNYSDLIIDDLFASTVETSRKHGIYRRAVKCDDAILYIWEGWKV